MKLTTKLNSSRLTIASSLAGSGACAAAKPASQPMPDLIDSSLTSMGEACGNAPMVNGSQALNRRKWAMRAALSATLAMPWLQARAQSQPDATPALPMAIDWPVVPLLDGRVIEPAAWSGQVSILEFWATWCPFCKRQNAHLDKLYRSLRDQGLRVLAVSVDGDAAKVQRYMETNGYAFPVALDSAAGLRTRITSRKVIPLTCVIDRRGRLTQMVAGEMFEEDVFDLARRALATTA